MSRKSRVTYFYDGDYTGYYYGADHPMKPQRIAMTHQLILGYGLHKEMDTYRPRKAQQEDLLAFHSDEYIEILRHTNAQQFKQHHQKYSVYGLDDDCPIFPGLFEFCRAYAGASIEGASKLNHGQCDIAINWAGGLHHAKKSSASGFCYVNDCVLGILELLKTHSRVLYIDIDVHHGDAVEEAFYCTDRVMTLSLHLHRPEMFFFPGTGALEDIGEGHGRGYAVNVPLLEGCTDEVYLSMFKPILAKIMETFQPGAVVLQCGADALVGDRVGALNLTLEGHAEAVRYVKSFGLPMLVLGGGGYTKTTVARAWTLDTATLLGQEVEDMLPENTYLEYFSPDYRLKTNRPPVFSDLNQKQELERIKAKILENLRHIQAAPGLAMNDRPPEALLPEGYFGDEERLKTYVQQHFEHTLKCVEQGEISEWALMK